MGAAGLCPRCGREYKRLDVHLKASICRSERKRRGKARQNTGGGLAAFRQRTPAYLIEAMRAAFPPDWRWPADLTPLQKALISRWVEVRVMGETWTDADRVLATQEARETEAAAHKAGYRSPKGARVEVIDSQLKRNKLVLVLKLTLPVAEAP